MTDELSFEASIFDQAKSHSLQAPKVPSLSADPRKPCARTPAATIWVFVVLHTSPSVLGRKEDSKDRLWDTQKSNVSKGAVLSGSVVGVASVGEVVFWKLY